MKCKCGIEIIDDPEIYECDGCYNYRKLTGGDDWGDGLYSFNLDWDDPSIEHPDNSGSTSGQVYNPPSNEWPTVINSTNHTLSIDQISHSQETIEWRCTMRAGNTVWFENFSISSPLPLPVVACFTPVVSDTASYEFSTSSGSLNIVRGNPTLGILHDLNRLVNELSFITAQICESRFVGECQRWDSRTATKAKG